MADAFRADIWKGMMAGHFRLATALTSHAWAMLLIVAAFLLGGGARGDIQSLIVLRPLSVVVAAVALWSVTSGQLRRYPFLTAYAASLFLIAVAHLIPLPPEMWQRLPGRELVAEIDHATGQGPLWRPFSMVPEGAWNAFLALFVPAGLFLLLVQLPAQQALRLGLVVLAMGLLSAFIGLLQAAGLEINLYRIDTPNSGLFSNHNHQAVVLAALLPLVAYYASERSPYGALEPSRRIGLALLSAVFIVPAALVAGSRAGLGALLLSLISVPFVYAAGRRAKRVGRLARYRVWIAGAALVLVGGFISWLFALSGQNAGVERMFERDLSDESRWPAWRTTVELIGEYFPWGSGNGSFVEVYQIAEHSSQLGPAYMNHAHNDWIEVALTTGLPGVVLLAVAVLALALTAYRLVWGLTPVEYRAPAATGAIIACLFGLASVVDYPLRVPSVSCFFVYAAYLAHFAWRPARPSDTTSAALPTG